MTYVLENALCGFNVRNTENNTTLDFQTDWDYPCLADMFGANVICDCGATDGTVDCPHKTASDMITEAGEWLFYNVGVEADGRGTFDAYPPAMWYEN